MKFLLYMIFFGLFAGCATATPKELINARSAYQQASEGPAARLAPAELHKAQVALNKAEKSFKDNSDSYKTLDLAYVAQRKSQLAGALGTMAADKASKANSNSAYESEQADIAKQAKQDLSDAEQRADDMKVTTDKAAAAAKAKQELRDSEARTAAALAQLAKLAAVKEDERGLVVTLSGSVLFRSNESVLLFAAKVKLDAVGKALRTVSDRNLIIEGHTDSYGKPSYNQALSQRRADTVRNYLIRDGYPAERIRASGMGEGSPIGDNSTAAGRANNRRVEIIIERDSHASNQ